MTEVEPIVFDGLWWGGVFMVNLDDPAYSLSCKQADSRLCSTDQE